MEASEDKAATLGEIFETTTGAEEILTTGAEEIPTTGAEEILTTGAEEIITTEAEEIPTTGAEEASAESFLLGYASFLGSQTDSQTPLASEDFTPNTR